VSLNDSDPEGVVRIFQGRQKRAAGAAPLFVEKFVTIAGVHSILSGATPHYYLAMIKAARGRESVHVVNINHVLPSDSWIVCVLFYLCILGKTSVVK